MVRLISKTSLEFQELKSLLKNGNGNLVATDDLSVLRLVKKYPIKLVSFFYSNEVEYHEDTKLDIDIFKQKAQNTYVISKKNIAVQN